MLVLGIDPGTRSVGFGLVEVNKGNWQALEYGNFCIDTKLPFPQKLKQIHMYFEELLDRCRPEVVAVEEVFVSQNAKTTLRLGHARGVILLAAVEKDIPIAEYAPREIKKAIVGSGSASKSQIQWMTSQMLKINKESLQEDAADGLAVALCHGLRFG